MLKLRHMFGAKENVCFRKLLECACFVLLSSIFVGACQETPATSSLVKAKKVSEEVKVKKQARPTVLRFGLTPYLPKDQLKKQFLPLAEYLAKIVKIPVKLVFSSSYSNLAKLIKNKKIELAVLSPFAYVEAKKIHTDLIPLVTHIADGASTYVGYIVTRMDSGIETVQDLKNKTFAFIDKQSASGFLYPSAFLLREGLSAEEHFKKIRFAGNHGKVFEWVDKGYVDAGATYSTALKLASGGVDPGRGFKVIAKTGRIPYDAYCARGNLNSDLVSEIKVILEGLSTRNEIGRQILGGAISINGFVAVDDAHYDEVRDVAKLIQVDLVKTVDSGDQTP